MEAMAAEALVVSAWELDGYLAKARWTVPVKSGYSDIDVVGVNASRHVRLAECKVRGTPRDVWVVGDDYGDFESWLGSWASFLENIPRLWEDRPAWLPRAKDTERLEIWFCANLWFANEALRESAQRDLTALVRRVAPASIPNSAIQSCITSTRDVLLGLIRSVHARIIDEGHGKRFGNPVLDSVRELIRFMNPSPHGGRRVGQRIVADTWECLLAALGGKPDVP